MQNWFMLLVLSLADKDNLTDRQAADLKILNVHLFECSVQRRKSPIKTLPQRFQISDVRYLRVQRERVGYNWHRWFQTEKKSPSKTPQSPPKNPWKKRLFKNWLLRIIPLVKPELFQPFLPWYFSHKYIWHTLETSFTFFFSLQLWSTQRSHSRTNTTVPLFFSFSVINPMHPQVGEAIGPVFRGTSPQELLRTGCSCPFKWIIYVTAKLGKQPKSSQENCW